MANKRINDLQARSDFDATCNVPVDDASQSWRVTGAQMLTFMQGDATLITGKTADADPQSVDSFLSYDSSATALKKVTKANLQKLPISAKTTTATLGVEDSLVTADATSAAFTITLPTAVGVAGKIYIIKKIDSSVNAVTVDGAGSETIDGATTKVITARYQSISIVSDGTNWLTIKQSDSPDNEVWMLTANGAGSTNTAVRRFSTAQKNVGSAITYADSASLGASFTINEPGLYAMTYVEQYNGQTFFGISVNSAQLTTDIGSITAANRLGMSSTVAANLGTALGITCRLAAGDVIRPHITTGTAVGTSTAQNSFRICKISD